MSTDTCTSSAQEVNDKEIGSCSKASIILPFEVIVKTAECDPAKVEEMSKALDDAQYALDERYAKSVAKFDELNRRLGREYENYDEVVELSDKVNNGFGILEDHAEYEVSALTRLRLTAGVLLEMQRGLDYFDEILKEFGEKRDQSLAAEYEELNFYRFHFSKVYHEFNNAWLEAYINEKKEEADRQI